jgi:predicted 3-demethylubiquinone-9 3-methyltransferase (glyoxalase superfamily)
MQKITPFLWFDGNAEEAMNFYASVFPEAKIGQVSRFGDGGPPRSRKRSPATSTSSCVRCASTERDVAAFDAHPETLHHLL